jgi:hypothetical protein
MMILYDSAFLKIEFKNVPCRHLVASWNGSPGDDMYKNGFTTILQCCHENDIKKLLSDIRFQDKITADAESFAEKSTSNYTARHGILYHAVVLSNEVFLKFGVVNFDRGLAEKFHIQQFFANHHDAVAWLQQADSYTAQTPTR